MAAAPAQQAGALFHKNGHIATQRGLLAQYSKSNSAILAMFSCCVVLGSFRPEVGNPGPLQHHELYVVV
jgi:hypothetical protein